jgi:hypothetical protein
MNRRPGSTGPRAYWRAALVLCLTLAALPAAAQVGPITSQQLFFDQASNAHVGDYLAAEAGMIYTDNAQLRPDGSGSGIGLIGLLGDLQHVGTRLDYALDSDLAVARYTDGDYPTELAGFLDGQLNFKAVPGLLYWTARETYTQQELDPFLPPTPDNLENINEISTGPRLVLQPTLRTTITLSGQYSYVYTSSPSPLYANLDSSRYSGSLNLERAFSSNASAYLTGSVLRALFNDTTEYVPTETVIGVIEQPETINEDFTLSSAIAGYRFTNGRTVFDVSGGVTALRLNEETLHGGNYSLQLSRLLTPSQRLSLNASQQITDSVSLQRQNLSQPVPLTQQGLATGAPFRTRQYSIDWRFEGVRTSFDLAASQFSDHYLVNSALQDTNDETSKYLSALAARQLNPVLNWDIGIRYQHQSYQTLGAINTTSEITDLRWQVGKKVELRFLYAHSHQNPYAVGYTDNQVGVIVSYALVGTRAPLANPALSRSLSPLSPYSALPPLR